MAKLAIIGGTGLTRLEGMSVDRREMVKTPYGAPSCPLVHGSLEGVELVFLSRHGNQQSILAQHVNYSANVWALQSVGVERILAVGVVGAISDECSVGDVVVPDQIIDYTTGRDCTYEDTVADNYRRIDFSFPYNEPLRQALVQAGTEAGESIVDHGTYAATSGPRLETVAEIRRMERDGCSIVGMSGMPEAILARELNLDYAFCGAAINPAAGKGDGAISVNDWASAVTTGMQSVQNVLRGAVALV